MGKKKQGTRAKRAAQALKPFEFQPYYDLAVVGGGASGLACALACAQQAERSGLPQPRIIVLEKGRRIGASILRSGNGRCNFSNARLNIEEFQNSDFVAESLQHLAQQAGFNVGLRSGAQAGGLAMPENPYVLPVVEWLEQLGLVWEEAEGTGGLLYPVSNKAESVLEVLTAALEEYNVDLRICVQVESISQVDDGQADTVRAQAWANQTQAGAGADQAQAGTGFSLALSEVPLPKGGQAPAQQPKQATIQAGQVAVAPGGAFNPSLLEGLGLPKIEPWAPVLGPLATEFPQGVNAAQLDGVRTRALVRILGNGFAEEGEVLFREYGLSGIVVFNASRVAQPGSQLVLDLLWRESEAQVAALLQKRASRLNQPTNKQLFRGFLLPQLAEAVCACAGAQPAQLATDASMAALAHALKNLTFTVQGIADERQCQVHRGGVPTGAVNPQTLEAKTAPGLYVLGEALDVDGPCGGYNLHWAWACGMLAGSHAAVNLAGGQQ